MTLAGSGGDEWIGRVLLLLLPAASAGRTIAGVLLERNSLEKPRVGSRVGFIFVVRQNLEVVAERLEDLREEVWEQPQLRWNFLLGGRDLQ